MAVAWRGLTPAPPRRCSSKSGTVPCTLASAGPGTVAVARTTSVGSGKNGTERSGPGSKSTTSHTWRTAAQSQPTQSGACSRRRMGLHQPLALTHVTRPSRLAHATWLSKKMEMEKWIAEIKDANKGIGSDFSLEEHSSDRPSDSQVGGQHMPMTQASADRLCLLGCLIATGLVVRGGLCQGGVLRRRSERQGGTDGT